MSPLLPHPVPWPAGNALPWAQQLNWQSWPALAAVAIRPVPYRVDDDTLPQPLRRRLPWQGIPELVVRCAGSRLRPSWHASNGLYGFVGLAPGDWIVTVEDPLGRYLPARLPVSVPDRRLEREALDRLDRPAATVNWRTLIYPLALRPASSAPRPRGITGLWGQVLTPAGDPVPHALVQLETRFHGASCTATTWSDASGAYVLDLDGERPDPAAAPADVVERGGILALPLPSGAGDAPPGMERWPLLDQALIAWLRSGGAPPSGAASGYGPRLVSGTDFRFRDGPGGTERNRLRLSIGRQQRIDLVLT